MLLNNTLTEDKTSKNSKSISKEDGTSSPLFYYRDKTVGYKFNPKTFLVSYHGTHIPLTEFRELQDKKTEKFLKNSNVFDYSTGEKVVSLKTIMENKEHQQNGELQNLINSANQYAEDKNLEMVFVTTTLKPKYHNCKDLEEIQKGYDEIKKFHDAVGKDILFRKPTKVLMKKWRYSTPWKHIDKQKNFQFIRMKEFHKDWTVHDHTAYFMEFDVVADFIALLNRKKEQSSSIGRVEVVISNTLKKEIENVS